MVDGSDGEAPLTMSAEVFAVAVALDSFSGFLFLVFLYGLMWICCLIPSGSTGVLVGLFQLLFLNLACRTYVASLP